MTSGTAASADYASLADIAIDLYVGSCVLSRLDHLITNGKTATVDERANIEAGASLFLDKPIDLDRLLQSLASLLGMPLQQAASHTGSAGHIGNSYGVRGVFVNKLLGSTDCSRRDGCLRGFEVPAAVVRKFDEKS